ncbi:hypothetical protein [Paenirhodobacter populi]|uniref:Uncharacterized protein n=1 Tax=Paenirhodobacter populi TaxID=2306993 RepID=A0A443JR41_9RHOB|nr:hypothetical protein [Sinirhodobacter populi]RWR22942.1 hypothetical protein D2T30_04760 [Sinirhodobacter populi]
MSLEAYLLLVAGAMFGIATIGVLASGGFGRDCAKPYAMATVTWACLAGPLLLIRYADFF